MTREEIAEPLRRAILAGDIRPGAKLPSTRELVLKHGGSRTTANQALQLLANEGLVTLRQKSGAVVLAPDAAGKTAESRLAETRTELLALRDGLREVRQYVEDLERRVDEALGKSAT